MADNQVLSTALNWQPRDPQARFRRFDETRETSAGLRSMVWVLILTGTAVPAYNNGVLVLLHLILIGILPVLAGLVIKDVSLIVLWCCAVTWSGAQLVSDMVHHLPVFSGPMAAGPSIALMVTGLVWARKVALLSFPAIVSAVGLGWLFLELLVREALSSDNPWKYGLATPVAVTVLSIAYWMHASKRSLQVLLVLLAATSLLFDSRFQTGLFLICAATLTFVSYNEGKSRRTGKRSVVLVLAILSVVTSVFFLYPAVALSGALGERAHQQQVTYDVDGSNFLLATRLELPHTFYLAMQNPLLGIGSHGQAATDDAVAALEFVDKNVAPLTPNSTAYLLGNADGYRGYNAHTAIMGSFLFAGFLAIPFWLLVMTTIIKGLRRLAKPNPVVPAVVLYMAGLTLWDTFFSPLTTRTHIGIALTLFVAGVSWTTPITTRTTPTKSSLNQQGKDLQSVWSQKHRPATRTPA